MTDLVVLSLEAWDQVWRRNQYLVAGLLRADPTLRVLFVEPAADPLYSLTSRSLPRSGRGLRAVDLDGANGRLWAYQPTKLLPRRLDSRADQRLGLAITRAARRLGFEHPVLWINDPAGATTLELTGWPALYDITDDWLEADRTAAEHDRLVRDEAVLMDRCAEVVVCSQALARAKGSIRPVTLIPNAVDVEAYRVPLPRPADLPDGPVALYLGTIHTDRIDLDLCIATAKEMHGVGQLVLVGPAPLSPPDTKRLIDAGVILLGAKHRSVVPAYLQHADVLVVPHVVTPFTESLDPIKLYEYRAVGRPVVSTPVAGFRESGDTRVTVAQGPAFAKAIADAMATSTRFPAGVEMDVPTWAERVRDMRDLIVRAQASPQGKGGADPC